MNILQINKFYFNKGGAERVMFTLTDLLTRHGHTVTPFAMASRHNLHHAMEQFFVSSVETVHPQFNVRGLKTLARFLWSQEAATKLKKLLVATSIDIAHCHNIYHQISPSILPMLKKKDIPVVMTLHDFHLVSPAYNLFAHGGACAHAKGGNFFSAIRRRCVKNSYAASALCACELWLHRTMKVYEKNIDCFLAPSRYITDTIQEWGFSPRRMEILPNFITPQTPQPFPAAPAVLFAGRLSAEKGIDTLLKIIAQLPAIQFTIAGAGPMEQHVRAFAEAHNNVTLLGHMPPEKMSTVIDQSTLLIVPSLAPEVLPMVILEAFAHGRPVIASRTGGIPELVIRGKTGDLIEVGDAPAFAHAIQTLISDESALKRMGNHAHALVVQHYAPEPHYQRINSIYQSVIHNS